MSKFFEVQPKTGRALISIYDPANTARNFDEGILQAIFTDRHLGDHEIKQIRIDQTVTSTFIVDFSEKSLRKAQDTARQSAQKLTAANVQAVGGPQGGKSQADSTFVHLDQSEDIEASAAAIAKDPFTGKEADLAAGIDVRDIPEAAFRDISNKTIEKHGVAANPSQKGKEPRYKNYEFCVFRFEKKVQDAGAKVYKEMKSFIATPSNPEGIFNVIGFEASAKAKDTLSKHGIPQELDFDDL